MLIQKINKTINNIKEYLNNFLRNNESNLNNTYQYKIGDSLIVEGGHSTGKSKFLADTQEQLKNENRPVVFLRGSQPLSEWVKEYRLYGKTIEKRIGYYISSLPNDYYLIVDDAEKIQDARKLDFVLTLIQGAKGVIIGCARISSLHAKIRARIQHFKVHYLGAGAGETFDVTYFIIAVIIVFVAIVGAINLIFLAAAIRYLFLGTRIGGKI